jgi:hypothetical protein
LVNEFLQQHPHVRKKATTVITHCRSLPPNNKFFEISQISKSTAADLINAFEKDGEISEQQRPGPDFLLEDRSTDNAIEAVLKETGLYSDEQIAKVRRNEVTWGKVVAEFVGEDAEDSCTGACDAVMHLYTFV